MEALQLVAGGWSFRGDEDSELESLVAREVDAWYAVFYRWTRGLCPNDAAEIMPIYGALAPDFRVFLPDGRMMDRRDYWTRLRGLWAARRDSPPSHIVNLGLNRIESDHVLATFDLFKDGVRKRKFDSALFRRAPHLPGGIEWVYVHESAHE